VGGIADIVVEGETALLADVTDTDTFCQHLLRLVEDDGLRMRMSGKGSVHVLERFSYQRLMKDMSKLYWELLEEKLRG
jgi:glycosyltransferase involved in cell wall biosynthesis